MSIRNKPFGSVEAARQGWQLILVQHAKCLLEAGSAHSSLLWKAGHHTLQVASISFLLDMYFPRLRYEY